jgi:hypothetical protein
MNSTVSIAGSWASAVVTKKLDPLLLCSEKLVSASYDSTTKLSFYETTHHSDHGCKFAYVTTVILLTIISQLLKGVTFFHSVCSV